MKGVASKHRCNANCGQYKGELVGGLRDMRLEALYTAKVALFPRFGVNVGCGKSNRTMVRLQVEQPPLGMGRVQFMFCDPVMTLDVVMLNLKSVPGIGELSTVLLTELNHVRFPTNGLDLVNPLDELVYRSVMAYVKLKAVGEPVAFIAGSFN